MPSTNWLQFERMVVGSMRLMASSSLAARAIFREKPVAASLCRRSSLSATPHARGMGSMASHRQSR